VLRSNQLLPLKQYTDEQLIEMIAAMKQSCVLDICDMGGVTLDLTGEVLQTTRERIRQIEECEKISTNGNRFKSGALVKLRKPHILRMIRAYRGIVNTESW